MRKAKAKSIYFARIPPYLRSSLLLLPSAIPCSFSHPLYYFSRTGGLQSHLNSLIHKSPEELVLSLVTLAVSSLTLRCNENSFLLTLESRNLHAAPAVICPRIPLISFCPNQLQTLCAARSRSLSTTTGPILELHGLPPCPHPSKEAR